MIKIGTCIKNGYAAGTKVRKEIVRDFELSAILNCSRFWTVRDSELFAILNCSQFWTDDDSELFVKLHRLVSVIRTQSFGLYNRTTTVLIL
jgi:hypothetical protein